MPRCTCFPWPRSPRPRQRLGWLRPVPRRPGRCSSPGRDRNGAPPAGPCGRRAASHGSPCGPCSGGARGLRRGDGRASLPPEFGRAPRDAWRGRPRVLRRLRRRRGLRAALLRALRRPVRTGRGLQLPQLREARHGRCVPPGVRESRECACCCHRAFCLPSQLGSSRRAWPTTRVHQRRRRRRPAPATAS